jgi:hypothetical protein
MAVWRVFSAALELFGFVHMVALDNSSLLGHARIPRLRFFLSPLAAGIALVAFALVAGTLFLRGFSDNGFRVASQLAWRYASFVFFAVLAAGPACRITARFFCAFKAPADLSRRLVWGFCASYGLFLLLVFLPNVIDPSAGATLMVLFGGFVALIMALSAAPLAQDRFILEKARRALLVTAAGYFWLCYSIMALARLSGPHRPDAFYGASLILMVAGLLIRYADHWFSGRLLGGQPEQTVSNLGRVPN